MRLRIACIGRDAADSVCMRGLNAVPEKKSMKVHSLNYLEGLEGTGGVPTG